MTMATTSRGGGVGVLGLLTVLFVGLKLTGYIAWSWWWVLAPTWIPLALTVAVIIGTLALVGGRKM